MWVMMRPRGGRGEGAAQFGVMQSHRMLDDLVSWGGASCLRLQAGPAPALATQHPLGAFAPLLETVPSDPTRRDGPALRSQELIDHEIPGGHG
jgi:hypothetical protein